MTALTGLGLNLIEIGEAADLQRIQVTMRVKTVQALQIQRHMPIQHLVHRDGH